LSPLLARPATAGKQWRGESAIGATRVLEFCLTHIFSFFSWAEIRRLSAHLARASRLRLAGWVVAVMQNCLNFGPGVVHFLRAGQLGGHKFRRQAAVGPYVVDFVCFSRKLIIELDGPQHLELGAAQHDERRTNWLSAGGFHLVRFRNQELDENIHAVVDAIQQALLEINTRAENPPSPAFPAEGREPERD
jgi:very-short-patch-repair endonuclease